MSPGCLVNPALLRLSGYPPSLFLPATPCCEYFIWRKGKLLQGPRVSLSLPQVYRFLTTPPTCLCFPSDTNSGLSGPSTPGLWPHPICLVAFALPKWSQADLHRDPVCLLHLVPLVVGVRQMGWDAQATGLDPLAMVAAVILVVAIERSLHCWEAESSYCTASALLCTWGQWDQLHIPCLGWAGPRDSLWTG